MKIPAEVMALLNDQEATKVLTSVSSTGEPHTIVVGSTMAPEDEMVCAAEILMQTTAKNLQANPVVSVLVVKGKESYQVVGQAKARYVDGPLFETMKAELAKIGMPCNGVWTFKPVKVFDQSAGPNAGKRIA